MFDKYRYFLSLDVETLGLRNPVAFAYGWTLVHFDPQNPHEGDSQTEPWKNVVEKCFSYVPLPQLGLITPHEILFKVEVEPTINLQDDSFALGWLREHVTPAILEYRTKCRAKGESDGLDEAPTLRYLVMEFAEMWARLNADYGNEIVIVADVPFPCEARFLADVLDCYTADKAALLSPYPVLDVASVLYAAGMDPVATQPRLPEGENLVHHPLHDARQSLRVFFEALKRLHPESFHAA